MIRALRNLIGSRVVVLGLRLMSISPYTKHEIGNLLYKGIKHFSF